jgi:hypothetical protein
MPTPTDAITNFPFLLSLTNSNHLANHLVSWDARKDVVAEVALLHEVVRVADATSLHLDEDFAGLGCGNRDLFDCPWRALLFDDDSAARRGNVGGRHYVDFFFVFLTSNGIENGNSSVESW